MSEIVTQDDRTYVAGDVVQLKSGGPSMTFREYTEKGDARVQFMTRDGMRYNTLPLAMIRHARPEVPSESN
jgi:uncharacterized protein YodC (DUF2158 family)